MTQDQWQPIETAPKDGQRYLVYQPEYKDGVYVLDARIMTLENAGFFRKSSHWMPLPAAPKD
jgi:hypothetical protein